jgi:hypothetical protein
VAAQQFVGINDISRLRVIHSDRDGYRFPVRWREKYQTEAGFRKFSLRTGSDTEPYKTS